MRSWDGLGGGGLHTSTGRGSAGTLSPWEEEEGRLKLHSTQKTTPGKSNFNININNRIDLGRPKGEITREKTVGHAYVQLKTSLGQRAPQGTAAPRLIGNRSAWSRQEGLLSSGGGCVCTYLHIPVFDEPCWTNEEKRSTHAETQARDGDGDGSKQELRRVTLKS